MSGPFTRWSLAAAVFAAAALLPGSAEARKCFRESSQASRCVAPSECGAQGAAQTLVGGLCGGGLECCLEGGSDECVALKGSCTRADACEGDSFRSLPTLCPGSGRVTCCVPSSLLSREAAEAAARRVPAPPLPPGDADAPGLSPFERSVRNKISDLADYLLNNATAPVPQERIEGRACWPLTRESAQKHTVTSVSFGARRGGGYRCHAGADLFTAEPGTVVSVADGQVIGIQSDFTKCSEGWGSPAASGSAPSSTLGPGSELSTSAVMVYHPSLDHTVAYAEMDPGQIAVHEGQKVAAGDRLGVASLCGMLHVELYQGYHKRTHKWLVPAGMSAVKPGATCDELAHKRPAPLRDPTGFLGALEGKFCS